MPLDAVRLVQVSSPLVLVPRSNTTSALRWLRQDKGGNQELSESSARVTKHRHTSKTKRHDAQDIHDSVVPSHPEPHLPAPPTHTNTRAMSGLELFEKAKFAPLTSLDKALDLYGKCIRKVMKDEDLLQPTFPGGCRPPTFPDTVPSEVLPAAFCVFAGMFLNPQLRYTEATKPEAYKLLASFRPGYRADSSRFKSEREQFLLKSLQIIACTTVGILAWDTKDRSTAAKRYKEALDIGSTDPLFTSSTPSPGIECAAQESLNQARANLAVLVANDARNAAVAGAMTGVNGGLGASRKGVLSVPNVRVEAKEGNVWKQEAEVMIATDACGHCGRREVNLKDSQTEL
ncbi:hypothetical protein FA13DRAFT_201930 [Coprinellus micaceus]|uniref:Uncharacterized protein n=1 Tax=Coprinellus micaceus TaxID=71717 RepID=A0A4Y7SGA9_COPMI|nr:hypothetical protein FA13DRAFT_201930 [Coprinellus micaceus]